MIPPVHVGICETNVKITHQRGSDFVKLQIRDVASRTCIVAETKLEPVRKLFGFGTGKGSKGDTDGDPKFLHPLYGRNVTEPAVGVVVVGIFAEAFLVTVDEPGVDAQDSL